MQIKEEFVLEGLDPSSRDCCPPAATTEELNANISYFERLGEVVFFVCRRDRGTGLAGWKDTLLAVFADTQ